MSVPLNPGVLMLVLFSVFATAAYAAPMDVRVMVAASGQSVPADPRVTPEPGQYPTSVDWAAVNREAKEATKAAIDMWCRSAKFNKGIIRAPTLIIPDGSLDGMHFDKLMIASMVSKGVDQSVAHAFANTVWNAWSRWSQSFKIQYPAFPTLTAVGAPVAPPTPGISPGPPLVGGDVSSLRPDRLSQLILSRVSVSQRSAAKVVRQYADWLWARFQTWQVSATIIHVVGAGPVPSFSPPYTPAGPVVNGYVIPATGAIQCRPF